MTTPQPHPRLDLPHPCQDFKYNDVGYIAIRAQAELSTQGIVTIYAFRADQIINPENRQVEIIKCKTVDYPQVVKVAKDKFMRELAPVIKAACQKITDTET